VKQIASTHPRITRIMSSRITVTPEVIVCNGKTLDFETCEDTGENLRDKVRCKGEGGGGGCLHLRRGQGEGLAC